MESGNSVHSACCRGFLASCHYNNHRVRWRHYRGHITHITATHSFFNFTQSLAENTTVVINSGEQSCESKDMFLFSFSFNVNTEALSSSLSVQQSISCRACCECAAASVYNSCFHSEGGRQPSNHHIKPCCEPGAAHLPTRVTGLLFKQLPGLWS